MKWDGTKWLRALSHSSVDLPPPEGCNVRGIWMGFYGWTERGEGFGMRLDRPLEGGKTYTFTFTYAKDGYGDRYGGEREPKCKWSF